MTIMYYNLSLLFQGALQNQGSLKKKISSKLYEDIVKDRENTQTFSW